MASIFKKWIQNNLKIISLQKWKKKIENVFGIQQVAKIHKAKHTNKISIYLDIRLLQALICVFLTRWKSIYWWWTHVFPPRQCFLHFGLSPLKETPKLLLDSNHSEPFSGWMMMSCSYLSEIKTLIHSCCLRVSTWFSWYSALVPGRAAVRIGPG